MSLDELEYVGFWPRVGAALIDTVLTCLIIWPILSLIYPDYWVSERMVQGPADVLLSWVLPAVAVLLFWIKRQATPGKMAIGARIVDARTGAAASPRQLLIRYLGYFPAALPLLIGLIWVAFDPRKQGWHDKLAGTVVVRRKGGNTEPVHFDAGQN